MRSAVNSATLPRGPASSPLRQLLRYSFTPLTFLEECARCHGEPFTIRLAGFPPFVMLTDPGAIKDVWRGDPEALHSGEGNEFLTVTVGRNSVLVLDEELHARQRRILLPSMKGERMRSHFDAMRTTTLESIASWPVGQRMRMDTPMRAITLRVILRAVLGAVPRAELAAWENRFERIVAYSRTRFALFLTRLAPARRFAGSRFLPFYREMQALDERLFAMIAERRRQPRADADESVLADLIAATHADGTALDDAEIRDALVTIVVAGYETTSIALTWALEQIVPRSDVVARIEAERREVSGGDAPLAYLDAAIRESMRLRTILPFVVRLTKRPFRAGEREYPPGVLLCPSNHLVHRKADLYPEPEQFRPERFLQRKYGAHEWFPFGGGNRACLGMAFAMHEMKVVISTVLECVRLERARDACSRPVRQGITLVPHDGATMLVVSRTLPESRARQSSLGASDDSSSAAP